MAKAKSGKTRRLFQKLEHHQPGSPILEVSGLTVRYDGIPAIEDVSFRLSAGEHVAVVGPNGAGKSTLFKVVAGVLHPSAGDVKVFGSGPRGHICIAYLPQRSQVDWSFPLSVADVVMMGRVGKLGLLRRPSAGDKVSVRNCLELVGLAELAGRPIGALSGGQQQRMFIARALAQEAELMIMDEPLTGLDLPAQEEVLSIIKELRSLDATVMIAVHDLNLAAERFDRIMLLNGRILGMGSPKEVFSARLLKEAYGGHLQVVETEEGTLLFSDTCCEGETGQDG